jgi:methylmalonyl-CoA epimerase
LVSIGYKAFFFPAFHLKYKEKLSIKEGNEREVFPMKIKKIAHIGVGVRDTGKSKTLFQEVLGLPVTGEERVGELNTVFMPVGETNLELVQSTEPDGVMIKFIEKRGEGIHHLALEVEDIDQALEELKAKGVPLIDQQARPGAHQTRVAFLHPKGTNGILIELVQAEH